MSSQVLDWIHNAAILYGGKSAYEDNNGCLSFAEVERLSAVVGTWICRQASFERIYIDRQSGTDYQAPICVMLARGAMVPACYLGIARAGRFYAPMDPVMPTARLDQLLGIAEPDVLITDRSSYEKTLTLNTDARIVILEDILEGDIDRDLLDEAYRAITADSPLYMIFTSGSSGRPKGVLTSHRALSYYINDLQNVISLGVADVLGCQAPFDYIAVIRDIYLPLFTGASAYILDPAEFAMPAALFDTMNIKKVTAICWSAAGLEIPTRLGAFSDEKKPKYLKVVVFSGSVISNRALRMWQDALPGATFINQYGPTECTASCTYYVISGPVDNDEVIPIGTPYDHYNVFLAKREPDGRMTVIKEPSDIGEICVAGPCLAMEYYRDHARTEESFIEYLFDDGHPVRIYLTGDLGSYGENGQLYFHGRKDRQIKLMGHRVELSEIETCCMHLDGIDECAAIYDGERSRICLHYTGEADSSWISRVLRDLLPAYMVPRKVTKHDDLPHLPNGKVDMKSLQDITEGK